MGWFYPETKNIEIKLKLLVHENYKKTGRAWLSNIQKERNFVNADEKKEIFEMLNFFIKEASSKFCDYGECVSGQILK